MASGFLILDDGRAFSVRWFAHDLFIRAIADELTESDAEKALGEWLYSLLPGPNDIEHIGYGPWVRTTDNQVVSRVFDVRELTKDNRHFFHSAAIRAHHKFTDGDESVIPIDYSTTFDRLIAMLQSFRNGEPPETINDWRDEYTEEPTGKQSGPGW